MIRDRLKELEIKITELADYLQISRPTMYKFITLYDEGQKKEISPSVARLFDYIEKEQLIGKRNVINYILNNMSMRQEIDTPQVNKLVKLIKEYVSENPKSEKTQFIEKCVSSSQFDLMIHYLLEIKSLINKKSLSEEDKQKLEPYYEIIKLYSNITKE